MNIIKHTLSLNNQPLHFFAPENDSVVPGTVVGMQEDNWKINAVKFEKDDIFVDLGCSIGIVSMVFAKLFPFIKVYSFDANPVVIECLKSGIKENNINNVTLYNLAIGDKSKKDVEFLTYNENESCLVQKELCTNERLKSYKCNMLSIAELFDNYIPKDKKIKYLKMDIETGEFPVFDYIYQNRLDILDRIEYLQLEIHPFDDNNPPSKLLKEKIKKTFGNRAMF